MMDLKEIQTLLPHRYPFLFVDRVLELVPGVRLMAYKNVTINEPFFNGHFPGHPVMPGVLVLEALAQGAALLAYKSMGVSPEQKIAYLMSIDGAKFRRPVLPGDQLHLRLEVIKQKNTVWKQKGTAFVDGHKVAEAELLATLVHKDAALAATA